MLQSTGLQTSEKHADHAQSRSKLPTLPDDRFFNPYRFAVGDNAKAVVEEAIRLVTNYERYFNLRRRARKPADQKTFEATIEALVCDMIVAHLKDDQRGSAISLSNQVLGKKWRYRPACYSKTLPALIERMTTQEMDYLEMEKGFRNKSSFAGRGQRTLIWPGKRLTERIEEYRITLEDIGIQPTDEIIVLKTRKNGFWDEGAYKDYEDTAGTMHMRAELAEVNGWLAQADVSLDALAC